MAEPGNSAPRSFLRHPLIRIPLKLFLGFALAGIGLFAVLAICNAFDDDLSADAKAMLVAPPMGGIEDGNGFVAFLGMVAPAGQDQMDWGRKAAAAYAAQAKPGFSGNEAWKDATRSHIYASDPKKTRKLPCIPEARDCLAESTGEAAARAALLAESENALLLERYRRVRAAPAFTDVYFGTNPTANFPTYTVLLAGASLSLVDSSLKLHAGDLEAVVAERELEMAFHRRMIADGRGIITVMVGNTLLARDLLSISELLRTGGGRLVPVRARLAALTKPEVSATALQPAYRLMAHEAVSFGLGIREVYRDNRGWLLGNDSTSSPLENWAMSLFAQPNATANQIAAMAKIEVSVATVPAAQFERGAKEIRAASDALLARPWVAEVRNPVGKGVAALVLPAFADYAARMHDLQALGRMVALQAALAERGITEPAAIAAFVAGEGAQSHPDPCTGKAFTFDPAKRLLSFEPRAKARWSVELRKRYGRVGIIV